jgi:hypothetical protein
MPSVVAEHEVQGLVPSALLLQYVPLDAPHEAPAATHAPSFTQYVLLHAVHVRVPPLFTSHWAQFVMPPAVASHGVQGSVPPLLPLLQYPAVPPHEAPAATHPPSFKQYVPLHAVHARVPSLARTALHWAQFGIWHGLHVPSVVRP